MDLKKLVVDVKEAWVEYPGCLGFEVKLNALSRKELIALRKRCVTTKFDRKTRQPVEELNEDLFLSEFTKATVKGWKGFKTKYLETLLLVDVSAMDAEAMVDFSEDNAFTLVSGSADFDSWVNDTIFDVENFRSGSKGRAVESAGEVV
jgi:hypothetical protein